MQHYFIPRFDGVEQFGQLVATLISPLIFNSMGNYGSFAFSTASVTCALAYTMFIVKEPREIISLEEESNASSNTSEDKSRPEWF